jgi:multiple sugar transport system ATP-binding protein
MAEIKFENVIKKFRDVSIIEDITIVINDGEFFTFVGPSGCGKSTILNIIAGLEPVTDGKIYFDDTLVNDLSPRDRDVAMVFQSYALYPHMSVYENIAFPLRMKKVQQKTIDEEVKRIASLLGLGDMLQRKPKELSGGQRQRVALGRALIRKPEVFLMDEPLSNLDARLRIEMRAELKKLHHELKITTVYVTHDQAEAMSLSERIAVIYQGRIQQCGTPLEVYTKPANIFVGGFIGSPPMNFIKGTVKSLEPLQIDCNGITLSTIIFSRPPLLKGDEGGLIIGIRPEDIVVSERKPEGKVKVFISLVEPAGSFNWVDVIWNDIEMKCTARAGSDLREGKEAFVDFPEDKVIVFDEKSGKRLFPD